MFSSRGTEAGAGFGWCEFSFEAGGGWCGLSVDVGGR